MWWRGGSRELTMGGGNVDGFWCRNRGRRVDRCGELEGANLRPGLCCLGHSGNKPVLLVLRYVLRGPQGPQTGLGVGLFGLHGGFRWRFDLCYRRGFVGRLLGLGGGVRNVEANAFFRLDQKPRIPFLFDGGGAHDAG